MNTDEIEGQWKILAGRIRRIWAQSIDDKTGEIKGELTEIAGLIQREFGLAKEKAERLARHWAQEHQPLAAIELQWMRFNNTVQHGWADLHDTVADAAIRLSSRREKLQANSEAVIEALQGRFDLTRDEAAVQVKAWLEQVRKWLAEHSGRKAE